MFLICKFYTRTLRKQFFIINKNILLVFMQQNYFVVPTKYFSKSIKFWLFEQDVLLGQKKSFFACIFLAVLFSNKSLSKFESVKIY